MSAVFNKGKLWGTVFSLAFKEGTEPSYTQAECKELIQTMAATFPDLNTTGIIQFMTVLKKLVKSMEVSPETEKILAQTPGLMEFLQKWMEDDQK